MPRGERYYVGPAMAKRLPDVVRKVDETLLGGGRSRVPTALQSLSSPIGGAGGGVEIRLGQFSGSWENEPGESGADNVKLVKLYVQNSDATGANDWVPELDGDGEETIAVTINLFSHIPTRSGNDSYMWCAVIPISSVGGEYWSGGYDYVDGQDVPRMKPYSQLWLLLAAEC